MRHRLGQPQSNSQLKALPKRVALALAACFGSAALALPVGPQVVAGNAAITQAGNALTVANSPGAILNWQTFNIGANERVRFEHFTEEFRRQVVAETQESGASISSVALRHKLNANI